MSDQALVHLDDVVAVVAPETGPVGADGQAQGGAVAVAGQRRPGLDPRALDPAQAHQRLGHQRELGLALGGAREVLPTTAAAPSGHIGAWRAHPVGRGLQHLHHGRPSITGMLGGHYGVDGLARQRSLDEHDPAPVLAGHGGAPGHQGRGHQPDHGRAAQCRGRHQGAVVIRAPPRRDGAPWPAAGGARHPGAGPGGVTGPRRSGRRDRLRLRPRAHGPRRHCARKTCPPRRYEPVLRISPA